MIRKLFIIGLTTALGGAILGVLSFAAIDRPDAAGSAEWRIPEPAFGVNGTRSVAEALIASGHFRRSGEAAADVLTEEPEDPSEAPPEILGVSELDGEIAVTVRMVAGDIRTVRVGETVEGEWTIRRATFESVTFEKDGEQRDIRLFRHSDSET